MNRSSKVTDVLACTAFSVLIGLTGCGKGETPKGPPPAMPPSVVTTAPVLAKDVPIYIDAIGKCASPEIVTLLPQISGRITEVHFKEGTDVKKGDKLYTIDPRPLQAALDQAKADLELNKASLMQSEGMLAENRAHVTEMQANLAQNKSRQDLYITEYARAKGLLEGNAVAKQEFDSKAMAVAAGEAQLKSDAANIEKAEAQIKQSEASIAMAKAKINASQASIETATINLEYTSIVSPIDGRTGQRMVDQGNVVQANTGNAMVMIQRLDPLYADFTVAESELVRVRAALDNKTLKVQAWLPELPDKPREGDVSFLDNAVQESTGTVKLRATLQNTDRFFWPGQFVKIRLILGVKQGMSLVPAVAAQLSQTGHFVYVVKADSTVELRPAKLGQRQGELIAVEEGVAAGENVVTTGQLMLYPGAKVQVNNGTPPPPAGPATASKDDATEPKKNEAPK